MFSARPRIRATLLLLCACRSDLAPDASSGAEFESGDTDGDTDTDTDTDADAPVCASDLVERVELAGIRTHLEALQGFADADEGNRQAGSAAYDASAEYVATQLSAAGYEVESWPFEFDAFHVITDGQLDQVAPEVVEYVYEETFREAIWSPSGETTAPARAVAPDLGLGNRSTSGCTPDDYAAFPSGDIALVQRGGCPFSEKAALAEQAGASGLVIFNQGNTDASMGLFSGTLGSDTEVAIPVLLTDYATGEALVLLAGAGELELHVRTDTMIVTDETTNVFARTPGGDIDQTIMLGAHLDSVPAGPGINDNGSGSTALLEVALQFADCSPDQAVTFAFWGAEEWGLVGSWAFVESLDEAELAQLAMYLNFDMIASPNWIRGVHTGDESGEDGPPPGSASIEAEFRSYFDALDLPVEEVGFSGRSDYEPFRQAGVPVGGLATGANGVKSEEEVELFGGQAGVIHDPCYHLACDDIDNPNDEILEQNAKAIAHVLQRFAHDLPAADIDETRRSIAAPDDFAHACGDGAIVDR